MLNNGCSWCTNIGLYYYKCVTKILPTVCSRESAELQVWFKQSKTDTFVTATNTFESTIRIIQISRAYGKEYHNRDGKFTYRCMLASCKISNAKYKRYFIWKLN